jgi:phage-related holin
MRIVLKWLMGIGIFMLIETARASEIDSFTFGKVVLQLFVSMTFIILGYFGLGFTKAKVCRKLKRRRKTKFPQVA